MIEPVLQPLIASIGILGALIALLWVGLRRRRSEVDKLIKDGKLSTAEILGYFEAEVMLVEYRFTPDGHAEPIICKKVLLKGGEKLPKGTTVPVRYKASNPYISVLMPYAHTQLPS